jgi:hypothetical protein
MCCLSELIGDTTRLPPSWQEVPQRKRRVNIVLRSSLRYVLVLSAVLCLGSAACEAVCLDMKQDIPRSFEGALIFRVFPGPPNYERVNKGDASEPTYILKLGNPVCVDGSDFNDPIDKLDEVQVFPADENQAALFKSLRRLVGRKVRVEGKSAFTAHTGHHHAPLLLPITAVSETSDPRETEGVGMAAVQGFYFALAEGNGEEAAGFVVLEKRSSGPLSPRAMTRFYSDLDETLALTEVTRSAPNEFRATYAYTSRGGRRCAGVAIVRTNGQNLISSIRPLNGC